MNPDSPAVAYHVARKLYIDIIKLDNLDVRLKRLRELDVTWKMCFQNLMAGSEDNDPAIWHAIGDSLWNGRGTNKDWVEAIKWFKRAAEAGHVDAMVSLGHKLHCPGETMDLESSVKWFHEAAIRGNASGMIFLGFAYREGQGVSCDLHEAAKWFIKAVEAGDRHSMVLVGRVYGSYLNMPAEAVKWYRRAAEAGFADSFRELAYLYGDRESEVYNPVEAMKWLTYSAENGGGSGLRSMYELAQCCRDGVGTARDPEMAKQWLRRIIRSTPAADVMHKAATKLLTQIEGDLL